MLWSTVTHINKKACSQQQKTENENRKRWTSLVKLACNPTHACCWNVVSVESIFIAQATWKKASNKSWPSFDLETFSVCNKHDLECVAMPAQYHKLNTFHDHVNGEKVAYVEIIFNCKQKSVLLRVCCTKNLFPWICWCYSISWCENCWIIRNF